MTTKIKKKNLLVTIFLFDLRFFTAVTMKTTIFWDVTQCSLVVALLVTCILIITDWAYFSTLKMEVVAYVR
jgi:hypothetical protein